MKFHGWRCAGLLLAGVCALFLAVIASRYDWDYTVYHLFRTYRLIFFGYCFSLIGASVCLSLEDEQ